MVVQRLKPQPRSTIRSLDITSDLFDAVQRRIRPIGGPPIYR